MKEKYYFQMNNTRTGKKWVLGTMLITGAFVWLNEGVEHLWRQACKFRSINGAIDGLELFVGLKPGWQPDGETFIALNELPTEATTDR